MAEEKKDTKKKPASPSGSTGSRYLEEMTFLLAALLLISLLVARFSEIFGERDFSGQLSFFESILDFFINTFWPLFKVFAVVASGLALWLMVYSLKMGGAVALAERLAHAPSTSTLENVGVVEEKKFDRWEKIMTHANSSNSSDWRLAIIEADIFLEEALRRAGFVGENIGDMLKSMDKSDLLTLDEAWDAHKTRNRIAHDGSSFDLNERETKRIIALFESVLKELKAI
jgi:hypothetical protein